MATTNACDSCHKKFRVDEDLTLNDMREHRLILLRGTYWHIPCAKMTRDDTGKFDVMEPSPGKLVRESGPPTLK